MRGTQSIAQIREDRKAFEKLLQSADDAELVTPFAWGDGQTLLREALLIADHDAYHVGELVVLRRCWGRGRSELEAEGGGPLGGMIDGAFGLGGGERGGGQAEGAAEELSAATLRGERVDVGVADHDGVLRV